MSYLGETNEESCLSPLDSSRFIMERSKNVSINLSSLEKLSKIVKILVFLIFKIKCDII